MIDSKEFQKRRELRLAQSLEKRLSLRSLCYRCFRPVKLCLCPIIHPFHTNTNFVILMHPKEATKEKNGTGRLTHLCLQQSEIIIGKDFSDHPKVNQHIQNLKFFPVVLYPGKKSMNISSGELSSVRTQGKKLLVFVIDGTWRGAKKIMKFSRNLQSLPRIKVEPEKWSRFIIKKQPHESCLSTIEAVFTFLEEWNKQGNENLRREHHNMMDVFAQMVEFQLKCAADPQIEGFRKNNDRPSGLRNSPIRRRKRGIFFE